MTEWDDHQPETPEELTEIRRQHQEFWSEAAFRARVEAMLAQCRGEQPGQAGAEGEQ